MKIKFKNINKTYSMPRGKQLMILEDINLTIEEGDFVTILGESGCGKSTLLNLLAGLTFPSSGEVLINDEKVEGPHPSRSMLFQEATLLPWLTVKQNITFGCKIRGELEELEYRAMQFIEIMGLSGFEKSYPSELSVGMSQRVCLGRALIGHPEILLLDEPFAALDTFTRARLQEELINIWLSEKFTAVFVTHDVDEAILLGNKVVLLGGYPCRLQEIFSIETRYPRRISDDSFLDNRNEILKKFKETFVGNKRSLISRNIL